MTEAPALLVRQSARGVRRVVPDRDGLRRRVDALRRAYSWRDLGLCQYHGIHAVWDSAPGLLFLGIGTAVFSHCPQRRSIPQLF